MWEQILPGLRIKIFMTVVLGIAYPLLTTGICEVVFPRQANGSLIARNGKVIGSEIIAQGFTKPEYFHPRPSAAGNGYDPTSSGGTNFAPTNKKLIERMQASIEKFRKENPDFHGPIPADLLTTSESGLDPDLSPASARAQAPRIAKARGITAEQADALVAEFTRGPDLGFLGEPRVNVLRLNLALDERYPAKH
jgi:K+-transporting ATPase ATPase C chain